MCVNVTGLETGCKADLVSVINERLHILSLFCCELHVRAHP